MLDRKEIDFEISKWEYLESSYENYSKLASLYIIRDHMDHTAPASSSYDESYSYTPANSSLVEANGDSEFVAAISGKAQTDVWTIMDDLMDTLQVANPRVYNGVMRKLMSL